MSVLDRSALEESPLADLHAIASELSIDDFRRLRRPELITAILDKQSGSGRAAESNGEGDQPVAEAGAVTEPPVADAPAKPSRNRRSRKPDPDPELEHEPDVEPDRTTAAEADAGDADEAVESDDDEDAASSRRRRGRRGGRGRAPVRDDAPGIDSEVETAAEADARTEDARTEEKPARRSRPRRAKPEAAAPAEETEPVVEADEIEQQQAEGVVELLANGSGFVRVDPPDPSDDDVYISSAQVKRCELVSGDRVAGPKRAPRRSERFASLIRIETINGRPASELADSVRFDDLPAALPTERLKIDSEDPTLKAIEWLTPFGKGSRVTIVGASRAGKTEALRRLADALTGHEEFTLTLALAGVRPEEISEWGRSATPPAGAVSFAASEDAQDAVIEPVVDQARRLAARGADAIVLIDTLDGASPQMARKALASARNIVDGGSVTVIATASAPIGGETTVISLDVGLASLGRFPALDLVASGTLRPELLVGDAGAEAIARTRAEVSGADED